MDSTQNFHRFGNKSVDHINIHGILGSSQYDNSRHASNQRADMNPYNLSPVKVDS